MKYQIVLIIACTAYNSLILMNYNLMNKIQYTSDQIFIEELQNKNVYINDSVVLRCKLDTPVGDNVEWRKDCKLIKITDNMVFMNNHCTHWLAITQASVEDTGKYSCVCGHISTSADLTVIGTKLYSSHQ